MRLIGNVRGAEAGPTLVVLGGMHGNEPAGVEAARRVLAGLTESAVRGELVALAGNLAGLKAGRRFVSKDLNRLWLTDRVAALREYGARDAEDREQEALLAEIEAAVARARGPVYLVDMHTTSAEGIPFVLFGDTAAQHRFVRGFPMPVILGLEAQVVGAITAWFAGRGLVTCSIEGGAHTDPAAVENLEAACWVALAQSGVVAETAEVARSARLLDARRDGLPRVLEVLSRHAIARDDEFKMEAGFRNLHVVKEGHLLARDRHGDIRAPEDGVVILPLYQELGSDGFFWGRAVGVERLGE